MIIPVVITVYSDRSFTFITKTPPAAVLLKKAAGLDSASAEPNKTKVATLTEAQVERNRTDEDAGSQRSGFGCSNIYDQRYCEKYGNRSRRLTSGRREAVRTTRRKLCQRGKATKKQSLYLTSRLIMRQQKLSTSWKRCQKRNLMRLLKYTSDSVWTPDMLTSRSEALSCSRMEPVRRKGSRICEGR